MEDLFRFYIPVAVTFGVAFLIGYLFGQFAGHTQAYRERLSEPWPKRQEGDEPQADD